MPNALEQINTKLDTIDEKCNEFLTWRAAHDQQHKSMNRDVSDIRKCLFGDNPGLVSRVQTLWECKGSIATWRNFLFGILRIVVAAVIIMYITWQLVIYKQKPLPNPTPKTEVSNTSEVNK